jgi:hypothetical protein
MFIKDNLGISNTIKRRKLLRQIDILNKQYAESMKERALDELDEYVMFLETHRLKVNLLIDRFAALILIRAMI